MLSQQISGDLELYYRPTSIPKKCGKFLKYVGKLDCFARIPYKVWVNLNEGFK